MPSKNINQNRRSFLRKVGGVASTTPLMMSGRALANPGIGSVGKNPYVAEVNARSGKFDRELELASKVPTVKIEKRGSKVRLIDNRRPSKSELMQIEQRRKKMEEMARESTRKHLKENVVLGANRLVISPGGVE